MSDKKRFTYLLKRCLENSCTEEQLREFSEITDTMDDATLARLIEENWLNHKPVHSMGESEANLLLSNILEREEAGRNRKIGRSSLRLLKFAAVFAGFLLVAASLWKFHSFQSPGHYVRQHTVLTKTDDLPPGKNGAILTLADGRQVVLDSLSANGKSLTGAAGAIVKIKSDGIEYSASVNRPEVKAPKYNTLSTPAGHTFQVKLPDGTTVSLNAGSSIKYPLIFDKTKREVSITGEAYFEVAKLERTDGHGRVPFVVNIRMGKNPDAVSKVEVLGTHFNINAYADDGNIKTTLLEGSVNVFSSRSKKGTRILPGSQAVMSTAYNTPVFVHAVDVQKAIAWKNGFFDFDKADLKDVMQQIGRWYNVTVVYQRDVPDRTFWGKMQRSLYLSQVLTVLENVGIHFKLIDNKLIVMP